MSLLDSSANAAHGTAQPTATENKKQIVSLARARIMRFIDKLLAFIIISLERKCTRAARA
jgi:hypothetical protein